MYYAGYSMQIASLHLRTPRAISHELLGEDTVQRVPRA